MTAHLVVSTVVLALAIVAARLLPLTARTRYAVLFCAIAKFAIPTAVFDLVPMDAVPQPLRVFGAEAAAAPLVQTAQRFDWVLIGWAAIAALLLARWFRLRTRTIDAALRASTPASQRELDALHRARTEMRLRTPVELVRSPLCEAPAVLRVLRPAIVLPLRGCDDLDDEELRSLLLHECAHIARRDNLAAIAQAAATSLLWFHPLMWLASRQLSAAREEACDEAVAHVMQESDSYLSALLKICRSIAAPRPAGASCMASSNLNERMEHLMRYESIRNNSWPHRAIVASFLCVVALSTVAAATTTAAKSAPQAAVKTLGNRPYTFSFTVEPHPGDELTFHFDIRGGDTFHISPKLRTSAGHTGTLRYGVVDNDHELEFHVQATGTADAGTVRFEVKDDGKVVQSQVTAYDKNSRTQSEKRFTGEAMTLTLKKAQLRDVMNALGEITGYDVAVRGAAADTLITIDVVNVPWDQVLDLIARQNGLTITIEGKTIYVDKK
ncbi:MAG TPA: M56 family metallopeptidase [Thermoanaerobaculia bacterium]|jgi:beta-lactamase regulating signal transducer with metallopeptidase domain